MVKSVRRVYLDYNATAPLRPEALEVMTESYARFGNPSSVHAEGRAARGLVEQARMQVAALVGAAASEVVFTGGGSEANTAILSPNLRLTGACTINGCTLEPGKPLSLLLVGATEHPSVLSGGRFEAGKVERIPVHASGELDREWLAGRLRRLEHEQPGTAALVSVQVANSETGVLQPLQDIADIVHMAGGLIHADAVQAAGRMVLNIHELGVDALTLSAHKLGGPQGVGAIVLASPMLDPGLPLIRGGGQEKGRRAGTENVAGIAGFGIVSELALREMDQYPDQCREWRDRFERWLSERFPQAVIFGRQDSGLQEDSGLQVRRLGNTSAFAFPGLRAETLLMALDLAGVAVSSGSACSSGKVLRSPVLEAMGVEPGLAEGALRVSLGWATTAEDIDLFMATLEKVAGMLISRHKGRAAA